MKIFKNFKRRSLAILLIVLLAVLIGAYTWDRTNKSQSNQPKTATTEDGGQMNLSPPSNEDKNAVDAHKDELSRQQTDSTQNQQGIKQVTPIITDAGYYNGRVEVRSFVPGIFESGGTCTVTLVMGNGRIIKQASSTRGATTTDCPVIYIPRLELSSGEWTVTVSYSSANAQGNSELRKVAVP